LSPAATGLDESAIALEFSSPLIVGWRRRSRPPLL
jgi:hypothetical protein